MSLSAGARLGPHEIVAPLGAGGMGEVYKARDTHLNRMVAIKLLRAERVADEGRKRRFVQEAQAASALNHPNIVVIHDISSQNGLDYMVMECVAGKTLDALIPRQGMRLGDALKVAVQMADALVRAHAAGIVHRDLKPSNVMVSEDGHVKLLDFGLAKLTEIAPANWGFQWPTWRARWLPPPLRADSSNPTSGAIPRAGTRFKSNWRFRNTR